MKKPDRAHRRTFGVDVRESRVPTTQVSIKNSLRECVKTNEDVKDSIVMLAVGLKVWSVGKYSVADNGEIVDRP
jgi:hypothetical protein